MWADHGCGQFAPRQLFAQQLFLVDEFPEHGVGFIFSFCHVLPWCITEAELNESSGNGIEGIGAEFDIWCFGERDGFGGCDANLFAVIAASGFVVEQVFLSVEVHDGVAVGCSISAHGVRDALFIGLARPPCSAHGDIDDVVVWPAAFPAIVVVHQHVFVVVSVSGE